MPAFYPAHVYGGPIETVLQLCRRLVDTGDCEVRVLTTNANGAQSVLDVETGRDVLFNEGFTVRYCRRLMANSISGELMAQMWSYVRWADLVHVTAVYSFPTLPSLLACKVLGKPVVLSPRGALRRWERSPRIVAKTIYEHAVRRLLPKRFVLHASSEDEARDSQERLPGIEVAVVPNGVEIPVGVSSVPRNGTLRLLYLGRLDPIKGIENLVEACAQLSGRTDQAWRLTLAGAGEERYVQSLRALIDRRGLSDRVDMAGQVVGNAKRALFEHADVVVAPSFRESFGMSIVEALAHGVPVIAGRGTPWRRLEEMQCGLWVENDPENLAKAIERINTMPLCKMGQCGQEWMKKDFDWFTVAEKMARVYRALLARSL